MVAGYGYGACMTHTLHERRRNNADVSPLPFMSSGPDLWRFLSFVWNILVMEFFFLLHMGELGGHGCTGASETRLPRRSRLVAIASSAVP